MPNVMAASAGYGQTSCKVWLASSEQHRSSDEGKMQKPLKFAGVPKSNETISAASGVTLPRRKTR